MHSLESLAAELTSWAAARLGLMHERKTEQGARVVARLGSRAAGLFQQCPMHVPQEIAREATVQAAA